MSILLTVEIHGTNYSKKEIGKLSYSQAHGMLGAVESEKDYLFVCNAWNRANPEYYKELGE